MEYALIIAGIAAVIGTVVWAFRDSLMILFDATCSNIIEDNPLDECPGQ